MQVTVKPASIVYGEKDQLPSVSSPTAKDSQKHSKLHGAASIHTQRDSQMSSQSSVPQSKPGDGSLPSSVPAASKPSTVVVGSSLEGAPLCSSSSKTALVESSTSVPIGTTEEAPVPDSKDWQKKPGHRGPQSMQDQVLCWLLFNNLSYVAALSNYFFIALSFSDCQTIFSSAFSVNSNQRG